MGAGRNRPGRDNRLRQTRAFVAERPDRPALWALLLGIFLLVLVTASAQASITGSLTGGTSPLESAEKQIKKRAQSMRSAGATWYGPGLYGNRTACGRVLRPGTVGVAHKSLPCGTRVVFLHRGRALVTRVIDRGPYATGYQWDLTNGARLRLGFKGTGRIRYAVVRGAAKRQKRARNARRR